MTAAATGRFSVDAIFRAVDKFSEPLKKMQKENEKFIDAVEKGVKNVDRVNERISGGIKRVAAVGVAAAFATAAIVKDIVDTGKEFDRTLVAAAAKFDPAIKRGTEGFERLRMAAEDIGEKTEFNAQQGAQALKELAASGFEVSQAIAVLPGVVDLATASEIELGAASEMATKALGAFGLKVKDSAQLQKNLARVTDVMAMSAGKTEASMEGLFESIKEGGPISKAAGASMETFMAMAAKLAGAGIEGSTAGTTLKNMFTSFATKKGVAGLTALGVKTKDNNGKMRDALDILGDLEKKTKGMGSAKRLGVLEGIFGKIPLAGVTTLLDQGTSSIRKLRKELEESEGSTKKLADSMRDTVAGDIDSFTSAIDGVKIALFSTNNGPIREVIQSMTKWVAANKDLIVQNVGDAVKWIGDNLPAIVKWVKRIAVGVAVFYAWSTAVKSVQLAIESYKAACDLATAANWLFKKSVTGFDSTAGAIGKAAEAFGLYNAEVAKTEGFRKALNSGAMSESINKLGREWQTTTGLLGSAGLLGAAALVGYEIGSWLNDTLKLDEKINDLIETMGKVGTETLGGVPEIGKDGPATLEGYTGPMIGSSQGGSVVAADGTVIKYGGTAANDQIEKATARKSFLANEEAMSKMRMNARQRGHFQAMQDRYHAGEEGYVPHTPQVVSPAQRNANAISESKTTSTEKSELTIKDETGRAEFTKKPTGTQTRIRMRRSGSP